VPADASRNAGPAPAGTAVAAVGELVDAALREVVRHERADLAERLRLERERLDRPSCSVLVIGEFNKGKSSMINALLNARVCATDADVATAVPTVVRYADELCAATTDAEGKVLESIDPEAVEGLVTRPDLERVAGTERAGAAAPVGVEMGVPRALLRGGW
jgi:Predicted GTPases